jgi:hypothetical protein
MKRPPLQSFDAPAFDPHLAAVAALARAHALQLEQLAEAAVTMGRADLTALDVTLLARELVELTQQAAVIEAAARRIAGGRT